MNVAKWSDAEYQYLLALLHDSKGFSFNEIALRLNAIFHNRRTPNACRCKWVVNIKRY